jgi:hydrocephalus-inducing protein
VNKLNPGDEVTINISYTAKKNMKFGKTKTLVPIEVKNGARYLLEMCANITIPEITIENIEDEIDFGKVLCL